MTRTRIIGGSPKVLGFLIASNGREYRLQSESTIGHGRHNDVVLEDDAVSREHARIRLERGHFVIYDLASTNQTWVNDQQVQRRTLRDGDVIRMGNSTLVFKEVRSE